MKVVLILLSLVVSFSVLAQTGTGEILKEEASSIFNLNEKFQQKCDEIVNKNAGRDRNYGTIHILDIKTEYKKEFDIGKDYIKENIIKFYTGKAVCIGNV